MSTNAEFQNRQVIPRWHPFELARSLGYTCPSRVASCPKIFTQISYYQKILDYQNYKSLTYAADFIGTALLLADYKNAEAYNACNFILKKDNEASTLAGQIAQAFLLRSKNEGTSKPVFLLGDTKSRASIAIARLRKYLSAFPDDPIAWADLALQYTLLALNEKALKAITVALNLAPNNRFILRAASRFYLHIKQPDKAISILRNAPSTIYDPWLLSAEISICEATAQKSKLAKAARAIASDSNFRAFDRSELCSALATLEFNCGSAKKAKQLFECSLKNPNENAVAQFEWIQPRARFNMLERPADVPALFEADTRKKMRDGLFEESFVAANSWLDFQPFSSRPAVLGSYVAMLGMRNDEKALELTIKAELSSPDDPMLLNNQACALATLNKVDDAARVLSNVNINSIPPRETGTIWATMGLIQFRRHDLAMARQYYNKAVAMFQKTKDDASLSLCYLYQGREEGLLGEPSSIEYLKKALRIAKRLDQKEVVAYVENILEPRRSNK